MSSHPRNKARATLPLRLRCALPAATPALLLGPLLFLVLGLGAPLIVPVGTVDAVLFATAPDGWPTASVAASRETGRRSAEAPAPAPAPAPRVRFEQDIPDVRRNSAASHVVRRPRHHRQVSFGRGGGDPTESTSDADAPAPAPVPRNGRRVYVASLHTKPDQQSRTFQLTLPDPWATGCYSIDVWAASFSELHPDFRVEIFTADECQEAGRFAILLPAPTRSDNTEEGCPGCRRESHARGNFPGPVRVRSVRFQQLR